MKKMQPKPFGYPSVQAAMKKYKKMFGKEFPLDWVNRDFFTAEEAVDYIDTFLKAGKPVTRKDLIDPKKLGIDVDLSAFL